MIARSAPDLRAASSVEASRAAGVASTTISSGFSPVLPVRGVGLRVGVDHHDGLPDLSPLGPPGRPATVVLPVPPFCPMIAITYTSTCPLRPCPRVRLCTCEVNYFRSIRPDRKTFRDRRHGSPTRDPNF